MSPSKKALDDTLSWLYGTQTRGIKLGLAGIQALADVLGNPQQSLRFVHVAGTNGKGSVCAMLESICRAAGLKTGLFTSPHLVRYNERIQVNRRSIPNEEVIRGINQIQALISEHDLNPSFFEITMALAFLYFLKSAVDIVVLETGLGGRLDATNIVMPIVSVLTSIDLDHQRILGNSLAEIAREKAGIIKQGVPVVSAPQYAEVCRVFESVAQSHDTQIQYAEFPSPPFRLALAGSRQQLNAAVAVDALAQANLAISPQAITTGLASVFWPGRFQQVAPNLILDGAHNPAASWQLVQTWKECHRGTTPTVIFGGLKDKNLSQMLEALSQIASGFFLVPVQNDRSASPSDLKAPSYLPSTVYPNVKTAIDQARTLPDPILVTGSLYLVGEALAWLEPDFGIFEKSTQ
ncbi:MAG TPA: folylpolyglutamate synthase/dihydrofolate synthase family protein [Chthoniobacterales bacterium]|nr:folylpolyglutamate synthase/dihydrofolate synthase family protein [Chthoniobacterales bacterium]